MVKYEIRIKRNDETHIINGSDERKVNALAMSTKGIGSELTEKDIKELQKEFQVKYCSLCICYDSKKMDFIEKGHTNNPNDCKSHWTDIFGRCFNYKKKLI